MKTIFFLTHIALGLNTFSQDILTIGEVFNFDVGNKFHYHNVAGEHYDISQMRRELRLLISPIQ